LNNVSERVDDLENLPQDDYFIIGSFYYDTPQSTTLDNDILPCIVGNHNTPFTNLGNCLNIVSGAATNYAPKLILGTLGGGVGSEIEAYNPITNTNQVITSLNYEISSFRIEQAQALIQSYNPVNKPFLYVNVKDIQYTGTQNTAIASHITNYILDGTAASPYGFNNPQNNSVYYTFEIRFNLLEIQFS
jgi:hypothetical protein